MKVWPRFQFAGQLFAQARAAAYFCAGPLDGTVDSEDHAADSGAFVSPAADPAPWYNGAIAVSAGFRGLYVTGVSGVDTPVTSRSSVNLATGGSTSAGWVTAGRGISVTGLLFADGESEMLYGQRWLTSTLLGDVDRKLTVRIDQPNGSDNGLRDLYDVTLGEPPRFTPIDQFDPGHIAHVEIVLIAGDPHLYRQDLATLYGPVSPSTGLAVASTTWVCPTPAAPFTLTCDPLPALPILPFGATFDKNGNPSCGPGSIAFENGTETVVTDVQNRPSSGVGSGNWLRSLGETPTFDPKRRSSCGQNSINFGSSDITEFYDNALTATADPVYYTLHSEIYESPRFQPSAFSPTGQTNIEFLMTGGNSFVRSRRVTIMGSNEHTGETVLYASKYYQGDVTTTVVIDLKTVMPTVGGLPVVRKDLQYWVIIEYDWMCFTGSTLKVNLAIYSVVETLQAGGRVCDPPAASPNAGTDRALVTTCVSALTVAPNAVAVSLPNGYAERRPPDLYGAHNAWQRPSGHTTPTEALWAPDDATSLASALTAVSTESDSSSMAGTITPTGFAWATFSFAGLSVVCAGSDVRWVRLRARAWSPVSGNGPFEAGNPDSSWTLRGVLDNGAGVVTPIKAAGEFMSTSRWLGEERSWIFACTQAQLAQLKVVSSFAAQGSDEAEAGRLEFLALDTEFVGGGGCLDCGPNVADVPCNPASPFPSCWVDPPAVHVLAATHTPTLVDAVPHITVVAGGSATKNLRVRLWNTISGHTTPQASLGEWQFWKCVRPLAEFNIPEIPAGWTLTIDGLTRRTKLVNGATEVDAAKMITGPLGAPLIWPVIQGPFVVAVDSDDSAAPSTVTAKAGYREIVQ